VSIVITFVVIAGRLLFQASQTATATVYVPSQLSAQGQDVVLRRVRLGGKVADLPVQYVVEPEFELRFMIEDSVPEGESPAESVARVPVVYRGVKPDMFAPGRDVILDGEYVHGEFVASSLLTQCPSKYEPPHVAEMYGK